MSDETQKSPLILTLGCDPQITVEIVEDEGNLVFFINDANGVDPADIDGFFFNVADDSMLQDIVIHPDLNDLEVTGYTADANSVDSLSNGAVLMDDYDAAVQFGLVDDSTEGFLDRVVFTMWSEGEPLTLDSIDADSIALVVNSDTDDGQVLTVNDNPEDDGEVVDPTSCTFLIEGDDVQVEVILSELDNGDMQMDLNVLSGEAGENDIGDIRGLFFGLSDDSLLSELSISGADVTNASVSEDGVSNLGKGNNVEGLDFSFDAGLSIGSPGMGKDDIQSTTITLSHPDGLELSDFEGEVFAMRLTSVGEEGGEREGSLKIAGVCSSDPAPVCDAQYGLADVMDLFTLSIEEFDDPTDLAANEELDYMPMAG